MQGDFLEKGEMMLEKDKDVKKMLFVFGIFFCLGGIIASLYIQFKTPTTFSQAERIDTTLTTKKLTQSDDEQLIILYHKSCPVCQDYQKDILKEVSKSPYKKTAYYIDLDKEHKQFETLKAYLGKTDIFDGAKTPYYVLLSKNGKVKAYGHVASHKSLVEFRKSIN